MSHRNLMYELQFCRGFIHDQSYHAWTIYEVDEADDFYLLGIVFNDCCWSMDFNNLHEVIIHELVHCQFYELHANGVVTDEEAVALNEFWDDGFETIKIEMNN